MDSAFAGRRVLIVEDEMMVAWLAEDALADLGCIVIGPASRVEQALRLVEGEAIDAALLDVNLNGEASYPIADQLTARGVPFLFTSGYDKASLPQRYRSQPWLRKPYHASELMAALTGLLML